jgi:hypothetical protein
MNSLLIITEHNKTRGIQMTEMRTGGRISQVLGKATNDIVVLLRQQVARGVGKSLGALSAAVSCLVI